MLRETSLLPFHIQWFIHSIIQYFSSLSSSPTTHSTFYLHLHACNRPYRCETFSTTHRKLRTQLRVELERCKKRDRGGKVIQYVEAWIIWYPFSSISHHKNKSLTHQNGLQRWAHSRAMWLNQITYWWFYFYDKSLRN